MGLINWFRQVFAVTGFSLRSMPGRKGSSAAAMLGIAGVVGGTILVVTRGVLPGGVAPITKSSVTSGMFPHRSMPCQ